MRVVLPKRLCLLFVWECGGVLGHRKNFSDFDCSYVKVDFISCASLGVDLTASYLVGSPPVLLS